MPTKTLPLKHGIAFETLPGTSIRNRPVLMVKQIIRHNQKVSVLVFDLVNGDTYESYPEYLSTVANQELN
jgi:hypothetical protein